MTSRRKKARGFRKLAMSISADAPEAGLLSVLEKGEIRSGKLMPVGSNYTFLVDVDAGPQRRCQAIYKPQAGERPLRDFPRGTLYLREYATYLVSRALGWPLVPPTVIREGPHGVGSFQLFIEGEPGADYFTLRDGNWDEFQRIAAFDCVVNNADRKAGHCLLGRDGNIWCIDHGLTFHPVFKLRTVIWDFCGDPIPGPLLDDLQALLGRLTSRDGLVASLRHVLSVEEIEALVRRLRILTENGRYPDLDPYRNIPWPWE